MLLLHFLWRKLFLFLKSMHLVFVPSEGIFRLKISVVMSSNCIMLPYMYFRNLLLLPRCSIHINCMNTFSFSHIFKFSGFGCEWYL